MYRHGNVTSSAEEIMATQVHVHMLHKYIYANFTQEYMYLSPDATPNVLKA